MGKKFGTLAERLRKFRKSCHGVTTQQAFAAALGIDQQRLSGYENGTRLPHQVLANLVRMGANPYWLLFEEGEMRDGPTSTEDVREMSIKVINAGMASVDDLQMSEFYVLPLYSDEVAAGSPRDMRDTEIEGPAIIHCAWCPNPEETDYVRVASTGDSMEPTIPAGAIVTIDRTQNEPAELIGKIVAIGMHEGGVTLKRLRQDERGNFIGVPDNPTLRNQPVCLTEEGDRIIGQVQTVHARIG